MEILSFPLTPFVTNCYVLRDGEEALVIDPGEATPELLDCIEGYSVNTILNTHCHCDHCGGNAAMVEHTGAELVCNKKEVPLLQALVQQGSMFGVPFEPSPMPTRYIDEGDTVTVGGVQLRVLFTPGHSPGHIALLGDGYIISGDVLFQGSIGRTDLPGGNHQQLLETIRDKFLSLPDDTIVYNGHGPATTIGVERASNPFLVGL